MQLCCTNTYTCTSQNTEETDFLNGFLHKQFSAIEQTELNA